MKGFCRRTCQQARMDDYEIGYKRPPREHRFQPGKSGNPKGRPRKAKVPISSDDAEIMRRLDAQLITVGGRERTWREAEIHRLWELALKADNGAIVLLDKLRDQRPSPKRGGVRFVPISDLMSGIYHEEK